MSDNLLNDALDKLARYGSARNRDMDRELRFVTLTDDEALALLERLDVTHRWRGDGSEDVWCDRCGEDFHHAAGKPCMSRVLR